MPATDIWLPVFNAAATLDAALRSIRRQTVRDWRLLVADDGSTDATPEIAARAAGADPRIRHLRLPHAGLVAALQAAARASDAPRFARMDADDVAHPRRLELQLASRADVVSCRTRVLGRSAEGLRTYVRWQNSLLTHDDHACSLFVESPLAHPTALLRRDAFERAGGYRALDGPEDYDLWLRLWETRARFEKIPRVLLSWRDAPGRLTRTHPDYSARAFRRVKLAHLPRHPILRGGPPTVWGAGPIGRAWMRDLQRLGFEVQQAIDIDPRKLGRLVAGGVRVVGVEEGLAAARGPVLGAVGARGAREKIRERLLREGMQEGRDYLFLS